MFERSGPERLVRPESVQPPHQQVGTHPIRLAEGPEHALDLDRLPDRSGWRGLSDAACNRSAGSRKRWRKPDPERPPKVVDLVTAKGGCGRRDVGLAQGCRRPRNKRERRCP